MVDLNFDNMTDDQLLELVREAQNKTPGNKKEEAPQPARVKLSDGSIVEGKDNEELSRTLAAKLDEYYKAERRNDDPPPVQQNQPAMPKWDMKTFTEKFVNDPAEGLEFLETTKYGMPVGKAVPAMVQIMTALAQKVQELETRDFVRDTPEYDSNPETRRAVERIVAERKWQPSRQSFQDAFDIAKSRGLVNPKPAEDSHPRQDRTFIPPRPRGRASEDTNSSSIEEIAKRAEDLTTEQIAEILIANGRLTRGGR